MQRVLAISGILVASFLFSGEFAPHCFAQTEMAALKAPSFAAEFGADDGQPGDNSESNVVIANRALDHSSEREHELNKQFEKFHPIIETYIQEVKSSKLLGEVPVLDHYFLGQADFAGKLRVYSLLESRPKPSLMWSFVPAGFLQMIFADREELDRKHYKFLFVRREFLGEVRCYVFDVEPLPKSHSARFQGRIWVEEQDS